MVFGPSRSRASSGKARISCGSSVAATGLESIVSGALAEGERFLRYRALGSYVLEFEVWLRGPGATFTELPSSADVRRRVLLENDYLPGDLEAQIGTFIEHYNNRRYHESLGNLTPADVYLGRAASIIKRREKIKKRTFELRRLAHQRKAA